jgi:3'-phosphoadenosine 5'-phosphosulfate sulfotransferase
MDRGINIPDEVITKIYENDLGGFSGYDVNNNIIDEVLAAKTRMRFGVKDKRVDSPLSPEEWEEIEYFFNKEQDMTLAWGPGEFSRFDALQRKLRGE